MIITVNIPILHWYINLILAFLNPPLSFFLSHVHCIFKIICYQVPKRYYYLSYVFLRNRLPIGHNIKLKLIEILTTCLICVCLKLFKIFLLHLVISVRMFGAWFMFALGLMKNTAFSYVLGFTLQWHAPLVWHSNYIRSRLYFFSDRFLDMM